MNLWKHWPRKPRRRQQSRPQARDFHLESLEKRHLLAVFAPEISVSLVASGSEATGSSTVFHFERTGSSAQGLTVNAFLGGTATAGQDFTAPTGLSANGVFTITFGAGSSTASVSLPTLADNVHDPSESITAIVQPGSGYSIKPASDRATAIITAEGLSGVAAKPNRASQSVSRHRNDSAFAALNQDGSVTVWGGANDGGFIDDEVVDLNGPTNTLTVSRIASSQGAFAAILSDGSTVAWGSEFSGGDSSGVDFNGPSNNLTVSQIASTDNAFAAILSNGSVVAWGSPDDGGVAPSGLAVSSVAATKYAFAAIRTNGLVATWGLADSGGDSSGIDWNGPSNNLTVQKIFATDYAFAALRSDGSVVTWGNKAADAPNEGGNSSGVDFDGPSNNLKVVDIAATSVAFAALRNDGSVVAWGDSFDGGNASNVDFDGPNNDLHVVQVFSNDYAFAALRNDGSVVTWGRPSYGGDSSAVDFDGVDGSLRVVDVIANDYAFAAIRTDGSVVTWGRSQHGGDSSSLDFDGPANDRRVKGITAADQAFAALMSDGSVIAWGDSGKGGDASAVDFDGPANALRVTHVSANGVAFAALRSDGSVVTWGRDAYGGDSKDVDFDGPFGTTKVVAIASPFVESRLEAPVVSQLVNIEGHGNVALNRDDAGRLHANAAPITYNGSQITRQFLAQWTIIEVERVAGQNTVYARHDATGQIHRWTADATWSISLFSMGMATNRRLDRSARGSAVSPLPWTESLQSSMPLEAGGSIHLRRSVDDRLLVGTTEVTREGLPIDASWNSGFAAIAAEVVDNARRLLIRGSNGVLQEWTFDLSWAFLSEGTPFETKSESGRLAELRFQIDIDGNGAVGSLG